MTGERLSECADIAEYLLRYLFLIFFSLISLDSIKLVQLSELMNPRFAYGILLFNVPLYYIIRKYHRGAKTYSKRLSIHSPITSIRYHIIYFIGLADDYILLSFIINMIFMSISRIRSLGGIILRAGDTVDNIIFERSNGSLSLHTVVVLLITLYTAYLMLSDLGQWSFFHDERWQVEVIYSLLNHGEFARYNYVTGEAGRPYSRGFLISVLAAGLGSVFGISEGVLRASAAVFGIASVPMVYLMVRYYLSARVALLTTAGYAMNGYVLFFSRFFRSYPTFLLTFFCSLYTGAQAIDSMTEWQPRRATIWGLGTATATVAAIQASQFGKLLFGLLPVLVAFHVAFDARLRQRIVKHRQYIVAGVLGFSLLLVASAPVIHLWALPRQALNFMSLSKLTDPTLVYYDNLFEQFSRTDWLFKLAYLLGGSVLAVRSIRERDAERLAFLCFAGSSLFLMIFLFDRFADPRYVLYLTVLTIGIAMVGVNAVFQFIERRANITIGPLFAIALLFTVLLFPIIPGGGANIDDPTTPAIEAPHAMERDELSKVVDQRAVPPDYRGAYRCLNIVQEPGDTVIMTGNFTGSYLKPQEDITYLRIRWREGSAINLRSGEQMNFREVNKTGTVYIITTSPYLLADRPRQFIENSTELSHEAALPRFEYNEYIDKNRFHWPSLRRHGSSGAISAAEAC